MLTTTSAPHMAANLFGRNGPWPNDDWKGSVEVPNYAYHTVLCTQQSQSSSFELEEAPGSVSSTDARVRSKAGFTETRARTFASEGASTVRQI